MDAPVDRERRECLDILEIRMFLDLRGAIQYFFLLLIRCESAWTIDTWVSDFSFVPGRMSVPKLADRALERRTDLAHSGPWQVLHVSSAKRVSTCRQTKHDFVEFRKRVYGFAIRARTGGSGRENPLQQHKAVEWRANHDDNDAGSTLHCRLVRSFYSSMSHLFYFVILHFVTYKYLYWETIL